MGRLWQAHYHTYSRHTGIHACNNVHAHVHTHAHMHMDHLRTRRSATTCHVIVKKPEYRLGQSRAAKGRRRDTGWGRVEQQKEEGTIGLGQSREREREGDALLLSYDCFVWKWSSISEVVPLRTRHPGLWHHSCTCGHVFPQSFYQIKSTLPHTHYTVPTTCTAGTAGQRYGTWSWQGAHSFIRSSRPFLIHTTRAYYLHEV